MAVDGGMNFGWLASNQTVQSSGNQTAQGSGDTREKSVVPERMSGVQSEDLLIDSFITRNSQPVPTRPATAVYELAA